MSRIALLPGEPIRERMAGIGIRYLELARRLPRPGLEVVLLNPGPLDELPADLPVADVRPFERGRLNQLLADCDGIVAQGQVANDVVLEVPELPTAIDLYDPFLVENLSYYDTLGLDPYRNDHATWVLQMSRGDFFLCSSDEQRQFYLGFLAALGRLNPPTVQADGDLNDLLAVVPFGVPQSLPDPHPVLPERQPGERRLLFGGLYDWYDPWPVLEALERLDRPEWSLLLIRNPNPEATPQKLFRDVERWCEERGYWQERVKVLDWIPSARRYDLLRDVDLLVSTHRFSLETRLSLRTRFLDALAAGCPIVTTEGGAMSRLLEQHDAAWLVPPSDAASLAAAFEDVLDDSAAGRERMQGRRDGGQELLRRFAWERVLEPLVRFCQDPRRDPHKDTFTEPRSTVAPLDTWTFRLRRKLRQLLG